MYWDCILQQLLEYYADYASDAMICISIDAYTQHKWLFASTKQTNGNEL